MNIPIFFTLMQIDQQVKPQVTYEYYAAIILQTTTILLENLVVIYAKHVKR